MSESTLQSIKTRAARLVTAIEAVERIHQNSFYDQWGKRHAEPQGLGGYCPACGRFDGDSCDTTAAIYKATA